MQKIDGICEKIQTYLGMSKKVVGIKLYKPGITFDESGYDRIDGRVTFCRLVHEAANGKKYIMQLEDLNCVNAEITLGFREPKYFKLEPRMMNPTVAIRIGPVADSDVVMLVLSPEQVMTSALLVEGVSIRFVKNRAVCGDTVARVYNEGQPVVTFLCIGSRTSGGFEDHELLMAMPYKTFLELPARMGKFASMSRKAKEGLTQRLLSLR